MSARHPVEVDRLASDLVVEAARLVRLVRRENQLPAWSRMLSLLDEHGSLGVSALAAADRSAQPTVSVAVADLVERGMVAKRTDPSDRRSTVVELTEAGRRELAELRRLNGAMVAARLRRAGAPDSAALRTAVDVLRAALADAPADGVQTSDNPNADDTGRRPVSDE
ncbi:MarR family winged helix-turn-helix transcriptional regulator [Georgenia deserti]|uniref:MarR family winged helix-turn-helix transcriptional regulator n=1 Tax=Georgenia deserti TaxID=2093781 RepID=A0ABW4L5V7_9MICO